MTTTVAPIVGPHAQNSRLAIQKATLKKQLLYAEFSEQVTVEEKPRAFTMQGTEHVHPDLEACFAALVPHFCLLTEQLDEGHYEGNYWLDEHGQSTHSDFDSYGVTGLIIGSKNGVTLMGYRTLESGKVLNMTGQYVSFAVGPAEQFEETDTWHYAHTEALKTAVDAALGEIELALRGKCSEAGRQLDMFAQQPEEAITEFGETTTEQPAPTKKRKAKRVATE